MSEIEILLDRGANINYTDKEGSSSLSIALSWEEDELAIALVEAGADLSAKGDEASPLEYAIYYELDIKIIESMLNKGASLEFDIEGVTPLEYSRKIEDIELTNLLLEHTKNM